MSGAVTLTPTLNQANFGTGVFGTAKYGQYRVTLNSGVDATNSTSPEFGLTENFQYDSGQIEGSGGGFGSTKRTQNTVFAGELTLPSSFSGDAECIWEHGGSGQGSWLGIAIINGVYYLRFRAGEGDGSVQDNTAGDIALANVAISNIPEFDGNTHTMVWEIKPGAAGRIRLWIDGRNIIDQETSGGAQLEGGSWSGGDVGGWGQGFSGIAGLTTTSGSGGTRIQYQAATAFSGTIQSNLRVYNNQLVGALTAPAQPNVAESLASVSATGAVSAVTATNDSSKTLTGVAGTGAIEQVAAGGFEIDVTERVTGVSATGQVGSVETILDTAFPVGVQATGSIGTVNVGTALQNLTGVVGTTSVGTVQPNISEKISGVSATFTVNASGLSIRSINRVPVTGASVTGSIGSLGGGVSESLSSVSATGSIAAVTANPSAGVSGVSATGAIGTLVENVSEALASVAGTGAIGTIEPKITEKPSGVSGTGSVGSVSTATGAGLTGVSATGGIGTLEHSNTVGLSGVSGTAVCGGVEPQPSEALASVSATGAVGTLSVSATSNVAVSSVAATGSIGTIEPQVTEDLGANVVTGVSATTTVATLTVNVSETLASVSATGSVNGTTETGVVTTFVASNYSRQRTLKIIPNETVAQRRKVA